MPEAVPTQIKSAPGIKRDGTALEGDNYLDGQWVRFQRGLPRKMGGYRSVNKYLKGLPRALHAYVLDLLVYVHAGSAAYLERLTVDPALNTSIIDDRTPTTLVHDARNMWQFDVGTQSLAGVNNGLQLIAQVAPNLESPANSEGGQLFVGSAFGTAPLVEVPRSAMRAGADASLTGGVVSLAPYTVVFGNDGFVQWSTPGDPADFIGDGSGFAYVTGQKIVAGLPMRGGPGASPSGLLWSADTLLRMTWQNDLTAAFSFDTITAQSSILSPNCPVEFDGVYYWIGSGRFMMFNGVVRELENNMNINFFFDNLNWNQRQKVFVNKVPRWGEIWWCFPFGDSEEPNHAVIFNVRENTWYDTPLPNTGRGAGHYPAIFRRPIFTGTQIVKVPLGTHPETYTNGYRLWVHEHGVDEVQDNIANPIRSFFETNDIELPGMTKSTTVTVLEPDFVQRGPMTVQILGRANSRAGDVGGPLMTFLDTPTTPEEQVVFFKEGRRQLRFRFTSDVIGGHYEMGICYAHLLPGDGTMLGALK